jgi:hypothetical protein
MLNVAELEKRKIRYYMQVQQYLRIGIGGNYRTKQTTRLQLSFIQDMLSFDGSA